MHELNHEWQERLGWVKKWGGSGRCGRKGRALDMRSAFSTLSPDPATFSSALCIYSRWWINLSGPGHGQILKEGVLRAKATGECANRTWWPWKWVEVMDLEHCEWSWGQMINFDHFAKDSHVGNVCQIHRTLKEMISNSCSCWPLYTSYTEYSSDQKCEPEWTLLATSKIMMKMMMAMMVVTPPLVPTSIMNDVNGPWTA